MGAALEKAHHCVFIAFAKQLQVNLAAGVRLVNRCERHRVALELVGVDVQAQCPGAVVFGVNQMHGLRRMKNGATVLLFRVVDGKKARHHRNDIQSDGHGQANHGQPVFFEGPPDELPLGSDCQAAGAGVVGGVACDGCHV